MIFLFISLKNNHLDQSLRTIRLYNSFQSTRMTKGFDNVFTA
jgi:hypothetical protein